MDAYEELPLYLRPAGGGIYLVSTGREQQLALQKKLYGAGTEAEVQRRFADTLRAIPSARGLILGMPSDTGAGFVRGASLAPQAIREALIADPSWKRTLEDLGVIDIGDVFVVPQLLHDEMLGPDQLSATRDALYARVPDDERCRLPVSPLSIAERVFDIVFALNPSIKPFVIGGDHSNAWPVVSALSRARSDRWAIVQPDAHTDLLPERLGIRYCFATWSYHANELLGRDGRMVQVGTRASGRDRQHWESSLGVRQFWADECRDRPEACLDAIIDHLRAVGADSVYFSNDIDGTDSSFASATGTPESAGLEPEFVSTLIRRLGAEIGILGGDIVEVAPPLPEGQATVALAAGYFRETIRAAFP